MQNENEIIEAEDEAVEVTSLSDNQPMVLPPGGTEPVPLAQYQEAEVSWMDSDPAALQSALDRRSANRDALMAWIRNSLIEGMDFGEIQTKRGASKPSLWKSGAEKIAGMLGLRADWPDLYEVLREVSAGSGIVALRCQLIDAHGNIVSEGVGARSLDQDRNDVNKALKMAKKSSLIDAVLNAAGLSEVFTQDKTDEDDPKGNATLDDDDTAYLFDIAKDLFGQQARPILESLARRRFRIEDGNWSNIPQARLADAVRSLQQKAQQENGE